MKRLQIAERCSSVEDSKLAVVIKTEKDLEQTGRRKSMRISQAPRKVIDDRADEIVKGLRRLTVPATKPKSVATKIRAFEQSIKEEDLGVMIKEENVEVVIKEVKPKLRRKSFTKTVNAPQPDPQWNFMKLLFQPPTPKPIELFGQKRTIIAKRTTLDGKQEFLVQRD